MALSYVGGTSGTGTSTGYTVSLSGTLTGGSGSSPLAGDIVVVCSAFANAGASAPSVSGNTSGTYTALQAATYVNDTWDTEFVGMYKVMGATPDTTLTITRVTNAAYGGATVVQVWRGQHATTPINQNATTTSAGNISRGTPPAVTPSVADSIVIGFGTGTQTTAGTAFTISAPLSSNQISVKSDGTTSDIGVWIASTTGTNGVATTPTIWTGGTTSTSSSWAAKTIVLAPTPNVAPTVTTQAVTDVTDTTATGNGNITDNGGATITEKGVCYMTGISGDPTTANSKFYDNTNSTGAFTEAMTGLSFSTNYRVRAYAINSAGTSYGLTVQLTTNAAPPTVALNTPSDTATVTDATPTLAFTGTSPSAFDLEYNIQVDTTNSFSSQFLAAANFTKTLATGENNASAITNDTNYVYVGTWTAPAKVVRINKSDFTTTVTKTLATGEDSAYAITSDTNYVYVGTGTSPAKVVRILKSDFTTTVTKTLATGENSATAITSDTNYVYVGTGTSPAKVVRINKSDFTTTVTKTLATGENFAYAITNDTNYVYVTTYTTPAKVVRINKSDFTTTVTKTLATGENFAYAITNDTNYVYVGTWTAPAKVVRINKSDFTTTVTKTLATGEDNARSITNDADYVYVGTYNTPAKVVRILKSDFTTTVTKTLASGENHALAITNDTNYVYVGTDTSPAKVVRISIGPLFSKLSATDTGFVDVTNGADTHPFASGDEISYTVQPADILAPGTYYWRAAAIDPSGSNTYGDWATTYSFTLSGAGINGIKVWNGSTWAYKPVKVWNGSAWVVKPVKVWNGSSWITKG